MEAPSDWEDAPVIVISNFFVVRAPLSDVTTVNGTKNTICSRGIPSRNVIMLQWFDTAPDGDSLAVSAAGDIKLASSSQYRRGFQDTAESLDQKS